MSWRPRYYVLNQHHLPVAVDVITWGVWFESADRTVARTELESGVVVSTVFLGLDHSFGSPLPVLFETMVFGGPHDQACERYITWDEAETGHREMVERCVAAVVEREP